MKSKQSFVTNSSSTSFLIAKKKVGDPVKITITLEFELNDNNLIEEDMIDYLSERPRCKDLLDKINEVIENGGSVHRLTVDSHSSLLIPFEQFDTEETYFLEDLE